MATLGPFYTSKKSRDCIRFQYDFDQNIVLSAILGFSFVVGLLMVFSGYRFFRTSLFLQCCSIASMLTYILISNFLNFSDTVDGAITGSAGVVFGIVGMFVTPLGLLFSSLIQTVFVSSCIFYAVHVFTVIDSIYIVIGVAIGLFIAFSFPVLKWQRPVSVMYVCSYGAILVMLAIDFFFDLSLLRMAAYENALLLDRTIRPCWFSWTLLGMWPLLLFVGCIVQFLKTAKGVDHTCDKYWYCRGGSEQNVRLLSSTNDVISKPWIHTRSPTASEKFFHDDSYQASEDDVFLVEGMTAV